MRASLGSTSTRTFLLWPAAVAAEQALARRRLRPAFLPLLPAGYLLYRLGGGYRTRQGGGGPGMSRPPERLVTTGVYSVSRNPMYLGHLVFLSGLTAVTRSPVAAALLAFHVPWFRARVRHDEEGLEQRFGAEYDAYRSRVGRWLGRRAADDAGAPSSRTTGGTSWDACD